MNKKLLMSDIRNWINGTCKTNEFYGWKAWACKKLEISRRQANEMVFFIDFKLQLVGHCVKQQAEYVVNI